MTRLVSVPIYQQCNRVQLQTINNQFNEVDVNETINNQFNEVDANVTIPIYSNETINNQFNDVDVNARCHNNFFSTCKPWTSILFNSLTFVPCLCQSEPISLFRHLLWWYLFFFLSPLYFYQYQCLHCINWFHGFNTKKLLQLDLDILWKGTNKTIKLPLNWCQIWRLWLA